MIKIDFLGVGAEKSGTTWLSSMLRKHPQIFIPKRKELHYFNKKFVEDPNIDNYRFDKSMRWYVDNFKEAKPEQIKGEICPAYLWDKKAPEKIKKYFPDIKIIIMLRDPIKRCFSQYLYYKKRGIIKEKTFESALKHRNDLIERSLYYKQVKRYLDLFPKKNILILFTDDIKVDQNSFIKKVLIFLNADSSCRLQDIEQKVNYAKKVRFPIINSTITRTKHFLRKNNINSIIKISQDIGLSRLIDRIQEKNTKKIDDYPQIKESTKKRLSYIFDEDIKKLESLLKKDLSGWKNH